MSVLIMWDVHCSIKWVRQRVGSVMGLFLYMARVSLEGARMSSLCSLIPLCEVLYLITCLLNGLNE